MRALAIAFVLVVVSSAIAIVSYMSGPLVLGLIATAVFLPSVIIFGVIAFTDARRDGIGASVREAAKAALHLLLRSP